MLSWEDLYFSNWCLLPLLIINEQGAILELPESANKLVEIDCNIGRSITLVFLRFFHSQ